MRPPAVTLALFAAAAGFFLWGAIATRQAPAHEEAQHTEHESVAAKSKLAAPDFSWRFNALDPGVSISETASALFDPADDYWGLPREEGYDLVAGYCSACHSLRLVMQQHANETRWRETLQWMIDAQGMGEPPEDERELILNYLSEHFGA